MQITKHNLTTATSMASVAPIFSFTDLRNTRMTKWSQKHSKPKRHHSIPVSRSTLIHGKIRTCHQHHYNQKQKLFTKVMPIIIINAIHVFYFLILIQRPINTILKRPIDNTSTTIKQVYGTDWLIEECDQNQTSCLAFVLLL